MYEEHKENIQKLSKKMGEIIMQAANEGRSLSAKEAGLVAEMEDQIDKERKHLPVNSPLTLENGPLSVGTDVRTTGNQPRAVKDKSFRSMFYNGRSAKLDNGGFRDDVEFFNAILSGRFDPRLQALQDRIYNSQVESLPSSGGFSVPEEMAARWLDASLPNEITRNRCQVYPMKSASLKVPGWKASDFSSGAYAGLTMTFTAEGGTASKQTAIMRQIQLTANMGEIYVDASLELVSDGKGFADQLREAMIKAIGFGIDRHCIGSAGVGAGCPVSIQNADCKVEISGETGQPASTIQYANLKKMFARQLNPDKAIFIFNHQAIPDLLELSVSIGTGGDHVPILNQSGDGKFTILGRPAIPTSHLPAIGSANCVMFVDWSYYALGMRQEIIFDTTDSHRWLTRERSYRVLIRFDGMSTLDSEITPENGDTLSPIVGLAAI